MKPIWWMAGAFLGGGLWVQGVGAAQVPVSDAAGLLDAIRNASAGDEIVLTPGTYDLSQSPACSAPGTRDRPIVVRGGTPNGAVIRFNALEGFRISGPYWTFEDLEVIGVCPSDTQCEHGFHIVGAADNTTLRRVTAHEFNAAVKGNGEMIGGTRVFPDDVLIENSEFYNSAPRQTSNPVTPIDVVGGRRWIIRGNYIHDHAKASGDQVSYAAFLKGHSFNGVFERNLVVCEALHRGQVRIGLSFGGGGSSPEGICEESNCEVEHVGGIMRNNIIANCSDVGIYLNEAYGATVANNTLFRTAGIDVRFPASAADVRNNLLSGPIRLRDEGQAQLSSNLDQIPDSTFSAWFKDPSALDFSLIDGAALVDRGSFVPLVFDDYCAARRDDGPFDIGALEYNGDAHCETFKVFVPTAQHESRLLFAQFADGQGLASEVMIYNPDPEREVTITLLPRGDSGELLAIDFNGQVGPDPFQATISPLGFRVFGTDGEGELQTGSLSVEATGAIDGVLVFSGAGLGLAGVGASLPLKAGFATPAVISAAKGVRTGLAAMNLGDSAVNCSFELLSGTGQLLSTSRGKPGSGVLLEGYGHLALFVDELDWEPPVELSDFSGTLAAKCNGRISATAIQVRPGQYATLPVTPL